MYRCARAWVAGRRTSLIRPACLLLGERAACLAQPGVDAEKIGRAGESSATDRALRKSGRGAAEGRKGKERAANAKSVPNPLLRSSFFLSQMVAYRPSAVFANAFPILSVAEKVEKAEQVGKDLLHKAGSEADLAAQAAKAKAAEVAGKKPTGGAY